VGTAGGPAVLDPAGPGPRGGSKALYLESLRTARGPFPPGGLLGRGEGSLKLEFALRAHHRERETRYRTQLLPAEPEPGPWGPASEREFQSLPRGRYTLRIWARDYRGQESGPLEVPFRGS
jgi:hypothetical protein